VRKVGELARLVGIEDKVWVQVDGHDKVFAIADEDMERDTEEKTSSVHFLRFELTPDMIAALKPAARPCRHRGRASGYTTARSGGRRRRIRLAPDDGAQLRSSARPRPDGGRTGHLQRLRSRS
jgi:hypothetical protein